MGVYKVNVSLPKDLVQEIDEVATEFGLSRSGLIAEASARYLADLKNLSAEERRRNDIRRAIDGFRRIRESLPEGYEFDYMARLRADRKREAPATGQR